MKHLLNRFAGLVFFTFTAMFSLGTQAYYSNTAVEVRVSYEADLFMEGEKPTFGDAIADIRKGIYYMAGPLQFNDPKSGPKYDHSVKVLSITPAVGGWNARYQFEGTFSVSRNDYQNLKLYIPRSTRNIVEQSLVPGAATLAGKHPCIQDSFPEHMEPDFFWYFWNPNKQGCPLKAGIHYDVIRPKIELLSTTTVESYPEYERLPDPAGNLDVFLIFGADKDELGMASPEGNADYNSPNFRSMLKKLKEQGFANRRWNQADFQSFCKTTNTTTQTIEELTRNDGGRKITIRMLWGTTSTKPYSYPFYCLLNHAVSHSSLMIYNAHSGLGASVFLQRLRQDIGLPFALNNNQYQLFAFNGCSSYGYYNLDFFREKITAQDPNGTKNLDVITNGVAGNFADLSKMTLSVVQAVLDWSRQGKRTSYQEIIQRMSTPYLTAVNGDEDNN